MNLVDIAICLLVVFFALLGSKIGILTTISGVLSGLVGFVVAGFFYVKYADRFPYNLSNSPIGFFIIFLLVSILTFYVGFTISKIVNFVFLGVVDKFLGFLLGALLGVIVCCVLLTVFSEKHYVKKSQVASYIMDKMNDE